MPEINISEQVANLVTAVTAELKIVIPDTIDEAVTAGEQYIANLEHRGAALLQVVADPSFEGDKLSFVLARIKDEEPILETEVFSYIVIGAGAAQNVINSIQNILISAVQAILPV